MESNYWVNFWKDYTSNLQDKDEQSQVLRTFESQPISPDLWKFTLEQLDERFPVRKGDHILDLCSGNGLLSKHFVSKGATTVAVDVSSDLINAIGNVNGIETIVSDIRELKFKEESFDHVIIYAGIQYFNERESIELIQIIYKWLKTRGLLYIGDIPDLDKKWSFFNNKSRQGTYFQNTLENRSIVGSWFSQSWFDKLKSFIGFEHGEYIPQDERLIYSSFRFDYSFQK